MEKFKDWDGCIKASEVMIRTTLKGKSQAELMLLGLEVALLADRVNIEVGAFAVACCSVVIGKRIKELKND